MFDVDDARRPTRRDRVVDVVIAGVLALSTILTVPLSAGAAGSATPPLVLVIPWVLTITLPLALRRAAPTAVAVLVVAVFIAGQALGVTEYLVSQIAPFLAIYTLGAWSPHRRRANVVRGLLSAVIVAWFVIAVVLVPPDASSGADAPAGIALSALTTVLYLVAAIVFGDVGWRSALSRAALERRTAELQTERELTARQAVTLERSRIARELHDVVAHHVSVIGVQAGAARRVLDTRPDAASAALERIEASSRDAVEELRKTVLALRDPAEAGDPAEDRDPSRAPSTLGLARLEDLVRESREAGVPTTLDLDGDPDAVRGSTALAVYRIAQEALTNVRKHAGEAARADVTVEIREQGVELTIVDAGGRGGGAAPGTGMGQIGMRERVAAAGGRLETGPTKDGYRVHAVLPRGSRGTRSS